MSENLFQNLGVRIDILDDTNFLKIRETLTRIGISSRRDNKLFQSCHILHKRGEYAVMHFKEMFVLDGKTNTITQEDLERRNRIVSLLEEWGLIQNLEPEKTTELSPIGSMKILSHSEKKNWELIEKYSVGSRK